MEYLLEFFNFGSEDQFWLFIIIVLLICISTFLGGIVSDSFVKKELRKLDEKYTYINEIFKGYIELTSKQESVSNE